MVGCRDVPGVSKVGSANGEGASTDAIARSAVVLDLARVKSASGVARGVTVENGCRNVVWVDTGACNGVGHDETTLRVAAERDLGVGAARLGLLDELGHDGTTLATHVGIAGNGGFIVDTLDGDAIGTESGLQSGREGRANGAAEVLKDSQ